MNEMEFEACDRITLDQISDRNFLCDIAYLLLELEQSFLFSWG
jgi:hypothetical protein